MVCILLILSENEFLSLFFLVIYLGAIAVLFLFVIMMLDIKYKNFQTSRFYLPLIFFIGIVLVNIILKTIKKTISSNTNVNFYEHNHYYNWYYLVDTLPEILVFGQIFYIHYSFQILVAGLILYLTVISVVFLTSKNLLKKKIFKHQYIFKQMSRKNVL